MTEQTNPYAPPFSELDVPSGDSRDSQVVPLDVTKLTYVGFWHRALARIIDIGFHYVFLFFSLIPVVIVLGIYVGIKGQKVDPFINRLDGFSFFSIIFSIVASVVFHTISEGLNGSTIGKKICGLVVLKLDGRECTMVSALGRSSAFYIDSLFFGAIAAMNMSDSDKKQRLGDKWNSTIVIKRKSLPIVYKPKHGFFWVFVIAALVNIFFQSIGLLIKVLA